MTSQGLPYIFISFYIHSHITYAFLFKSSNKISYPLAFLNQLRRVREGEHVKGVHELKEHLSYLGYSYFNTNCINQRFGNDNIFDDSFGFKVRKYKKFYNLNITGILDANIIITVHKIRCGLLDFYKLSINNTIPFHMISYYSFFPGHPKWRKRKLRYAFNRNIKEEAKRSLEHALNEWASVTPFKFSRVSHLSEADIRISFMRGYHGDGYPFRTPDSGLAHTFAPPDGRVHFNAAQNWSSNGERNAYDIRTVGLHELGHALGLGHSWIEKAVMYPIIYPGERKGLHEDDIKGMKSLYKF